MEIEGERRSDSQVLYETCHHASRPYSYSYPPIRQELNESTKGGFLRLLSVKGLSEFKEKWTTNRHPQKLSKWTSIFVSPSGEHVAVAVGNEITILQRDDNYQEPCGIYNSNSPVTFMFGAWSEDHDILGVFDNTDTLYFIRANGEEITRITKQHLRMPLPIISFVIHDNNDMKKSCLCTFSILASDGSVHDIEISQDPSASISTMSSPNLGSLLHKQFPQNVCCCGYHLDSSLLAVVSSAVSITSTSTVVIGPYNISLWKWCRRSGLEQVASAEFEGLYTKTKGYTDQISSPKVQFSPQKQFVATLDLRGYLIIYKLNEKDLLSEVHFKVKNELNNIIDFTWWIDHIIVIADRSGKITMLDINSGVKVLENDYQYSLPILEQVSTSPGCIFILESKSSEKNFEPSDLVLYEPVTVEKYKEFDSAKLQWSLMSFSKRSVQEFYDILITSQQFEDAVKLADHHGLDKDEVLKAQWLHSLQGTSEINMFLSLIKDQDFVLSECVDRVGPTENAVRALLAYGLRLTNNYIFSEVEDEKDSPNWDFRLARLKMLQFKDRLETFLGINMGRFSAQDYSKFRSLPIKKAATTLAESGKIGALNLLFKRHPYSISPCMLEVLAAIPETVPVQTYGQLLPGCFPHQVTSVREEDWVEHERMVNYINSLPENHETAIQIRTEPIVNQLMGYKWPSTNELSVWYKHRALEMDTLSGQLDNSLSLVDFACRKGINELQKFHELISYLHQLIYSDDGDGHDMNFSTSLATWEQLSDYEKFKMMLKGFNEENIIKRLKDRALLFMHKKFGDEMVDDTVDSFLVRWMKEIAMENKIEVCLVVVEEGCKDFLGNMFFRNEAEAVGCAIQCLYLCTATDKWSTMASILSKVPHLHGYEVEGLKKQLKLAEGHVEAGRLLTLYQVPKPIAFFLEAQSDSKSVKQVLRLILSKFIRRQPGRTDADWANMWRDFQSLQEKAFPFVDLEYMLIEFCRGLLKAGKFSLARNYLKGSGSVALPTEKAENIIILAAREYFFSAPSLSCSEIWKAKECLNILPSSRNVMRESDIIDALTVKLPRLGVNILPMQFRQIKDPMEIIKLAITTQSGAYLNVDELIEIAKFLGLNSQDEISSVQEAIAREAAVAGDLQLAFDLCLIMAKKGHGPVWDLCTALARGPALENMDINSRKQLLGFALSHCDKDSIGELLHAWKDLDMQSQCEKLTMLTGKKVPELSGHDMVDLMDSSGQVNMNLHGEKNLHFTTVKTTLSDIADLLSVTNASDFDSLLKENGKVLTFVALCLPWLLELSQEAENGNKFLGTQAMATVLSWLARNDFSPKDNLIASLAKKVMVPPVTEEEDILGCSFLLNLNDAFYGVQIIEEQVRSREDYNEICSVMNLGMIYSMLHNSSGECEGPAQRRELLLRKFQEKYTTLSSDERNKIDQAQSSFWREWKLKLEEQKRVADHTRAIEQIIPGIETTRFLAGDVNYMESVIFDFIDSVKIEKKKILKDVLSLASDYGLDQTKVLLKFLCSTLLSKIWTVDDIKSEVTQFESKIFDSAKVVFETISISVYPEINGCDKQRLAYIYNLLSICFSKVEDKKELLTVINPDPTNLTVDELDSFYKIMEQECSKLAFIEDLNFKNIAGLFGPNLVCVTDEVYTHVNEMSVEPLAEMMKALTRIYKDQVPEGLVPWQYVYGYYVSSSLKALENNAKSEVHFQDPETLRLFINELESTYDRCKKYIKLIAYPGASIMGIMKKFFKITPSVNDDFGNFSMDPNWKDDLLMLIHFWLRLIDDLQEFVSSDDLDGKFSPGCVTICLESFVDLVKEGKISIGEGWASIFAYINFGLVGDVYTEILNFCRSMVFSGCRFKAISYVYHASVSRFPPDTNLSSEIQRHYENIMDLPHLYMRILETVLKDLACGSHEHRYIYRVLSSLSELDGDFEELKNVRSTVWDQLARFSDDMKIPSNVRVHMLELMQFITPLTTNLTSFSSELRVNVDPWVGWDNSGSVSLNRETTPDNEGGAPISFTHTLVALKSSQLLSTISPNLEISPDDLSTLDSTVSCFVKISENVVSRSHIDVLIAVLGEWEGLFGNLSVKEDVKSSEQAPHGAGNDWGNDDWDEGWEDFQEEQGEKETSNVDNILSVHSLHECWATIFKKLASISEFSDILKIIDQSSVKGNGVLLSEDSTRHLTQLLLEADCFTGLSMAGLLPYEKIQMECLDFVEDRLKQGNIPAPVLTDHGLFITLLSSGLISTIVTKPSYGTTFSYVNYLVGCFSRNCQEAHLSVPKNGSGDDEKDVWPVFRTILLPCYLCELVKADQVMLAGLVVTKIMHTSVSLGLINVAEASLRRHLENQLEVIRGNSFKFEEIAVCEPLVNTVVGLSGRLENSINSALVLLSPKEDKR